MDGLIVVMLVALVVEAGVEDIAVCFELCILFLDLDEL
jgi:hypothetical protein